MSNVSSVERERILCGLFAEFLEIDEVPPDVDFFLLGGAEQDGPVLLQRIRAEFGVQLPDWILSEAGTVAALGGYIESQVGAVENRILQPLRGIGGRRRPLFCMHTAGGLAMPYARLLRHLDPEVPVFGIQARGLYASGEVPSSLDDMAADYVTQIRKVQARGPYRLLGWCFGGRVAHAVACALEADGDKVELLVLMDEYPPDPEVPQPADELLLEDLLLPRGVDTASPELAALCRPPLDFASIHNHLEKTGHAFKYLNEETFFALYRVYRNNDRLQRSPVVGKYGGDMVFIAADQIAARKSLVPASWQAYVAGTIDVRRLSCRHDEMMLPDPLKKIGEVLSSALAGDS